MKALLWILIVALIVAVIGFWMNLDALGYEGNAKLYVVGGGASIAILGGLYRSLGSWDLVPAWVPFFGEVDDWFAVMLVGFGSLVTAAGLFLL